MAEYPQLGKEAFSYQGLSAEKLKDILHPDDFKLDRERRDEIERLEIINWGLYCQFLGQ